MSLNKQSTDPEYFLSGCQVDFIGCHETFVMNTGILCNSILVPGGRGMGPPENAALTLTLTLGSAFSCRSRNGPPTLGSADPRFTRFLPHRVLSAASAAPSGIGVTTVQKVGGTNLRGPKLEARRAESGGGVLGEGAASPLPTS